MLFLANGEAKYFLLRGWTAKSINSPSGKSLHELMSRHACDLAALQRLLAHWSQRCLYQHCSPKPLNPYILSRLTVRGDFS